MIAEFERASRRPRVIAARVDLDETKDNPRDGTVSMRWTLLARGHQVSYATGEAFVPTVAAVGSGLLRPDR